MLSFFSFHSSPNQFFFFFYICLFSLLLSTMKSIFSFISSFIPSLTIFFLLFSAFLFFPSYHPPNKLFHFPFFSFHSSPNHYLSLSLSNIKGPDYDSETEEVDRRRRLQEYAEQWMVLTQGRILSPNNTTMLR